VHGFEFDRRSIGIDRGNCGGRVHDVRRRRQIQRSAIVTSRRRLPTRRNLESLATTRTNPAGDFRISVGDGLRHGGGPRCETNAILPRGLIGRNRVCD
jgi:hypothetical protein